MQRLFSTFPNGWPGIGILLQRVLTATTLFCYGVAHLRDTSQFASIVPHLFAAVAGILLLVGLWTPVAGTMITIVEPVAALAMNLQLLEPAIAPHISGTRQCCASHRVRLVISLFAVWLFATAAFALDPQRSITRFAHTVWTEKDGAPADIVAIPQTSDGYFWLGTWTGLFSFDGVRFTRFDPQAGEHLPLQTIRGLLATRDGSLWIVFYSGSVSRLSHGHVTSYSEREGFPTTFALAEGKDGSLIAGTAKGLARFKNGYWWRATEVGVLRIPAGELDRAVANPAYRIRYESFNTLDGLPGSTQNTFPGPMAARTRDGRIWFATKRGIDYVDPRHIPKNDLLPPVHVETIKVDDKVAAQTSGIVLNHDVKNVEIDYTAFSLSIPERVHLRYKLEGYDTVWQQPGPRRQAFYNGLRPGKYKFHVIACNNAGVWNESGATLDFRVMPAWYQTIWFRVLCVACFVLLLWALYQLRLQQLQRQFKMALEARISERNRIARELHDTLLQSFQGLMLRFQTVDEMLPARPMDAKKALECALNRGDQAISEGRDAITDIRASTLANQDLAKSITALMTNLEEELSEGKGAPVPFQVLLVEGTPRFVRPNIQSDIYRIARESLGNAFRHAQAQHIETEITYGESLRLRFRDDGRGIDPSVMEHGGRPRHWGLVGIRERAKQIGAQLEILSELGAGTEIELSIPGSIAYEVFTTKGRFRIFPRRIGEDYEHRS